jgi:PTH2 family peptidyl-tRNA hydrolase
MSAPKQVIVLRKDLNMRKGKMVAQGAHASMAVILDEQKKLHHPTPAVAEWLGTRFTKICVSVNSEQELLDVYEKAKAANIPCSLIRDAGLTEFKEPTYTAVAVGPEYPENIDPITGSLPLL